jgi:positive regulator of sigma E activity
MKILSSIDSSIIYCLSFLFMFAGLCVLFYYLFAPTVFVWAGVVVGMAVISSVFASFLTKRLKKHQWQYSIK